MGKQKKKKDVSDTSISGSYNPVTIRDDIHELRQFYKLPCRKCAYHETPLCKEKEAEYENDKRANKRMAVVCRLSSYLEGQGYDEP